jgi:hypothetical protein
MFKDGNGREWFIKLNVGLIEEIKDKTGVDLDKMISEPKSISEMIFIQPTKLVGVLLICCWDQLGEITPRQFGTLFDRELLDKASDAFLEAVMLFYPRSSVAGVIRENLPRMLKQMDVKMAEDTKRNVEKVMSDMRTV